MDFAGKALEIRKSRPKSSLELSAINRFAIVITRSGWSVTIIFVEYIHMNSGVVHVYAYSPPKALNSDDGFKLWNI